jgi:5-methylcytosine-specific restriction endonuclease McrA
MTEVLKLNSGFIPLGIISVENAVADLWNSKAYTVVESDRVMRSPSITIKVPSVIASLTYGHMPRRTVHFSKLNVIYRDDMTCQICGKQLPINKIELGHVIPKCRWKEVTHSNKRDYTNWINCVALCTFCNNRQGKHLLDEIGLKLIRKPYVPKYLPHLVITRKKAEEKGWLPFLSGLNVRLIESI